MLPGCILLSIRIPPFEIKAARTVTHIIHNNKNKFDFHNASCNIEQPTSFFSNVLLRKSKYVYKFSKNFCNGKNRYKNALNFKQFYVRFKETRNLSKLRNFSAMIKN